MSKVDWSKAPEGEVRYYSKFNAWLEKKPDGIYYTKLTNSDRYKGVDQALAEYHWNQAIERPVSSTTAADMELPEPDSDRLWAINGSKYSEASLMYSGWTMRQLVKHGSIVGQVPNVNALCSHRVEHGSSINALHSRCVDSTITQRGERYGKFKDGSKIMQDLKNVMRDTPNWEGLSPSQREALEMIQHKIGRILNGDPDYDDNWRDICGYSQLVLDELNGTVR